MEKRSRKLVNKRGLELAINSFVIIVLALVVLIALILFFNKSSGSFMEKISSFFSSSNIDTYKENCNMLASNEQKYDYCCVEKLAKISSKEKMEISCLNATNRSWGEDIEKLNCEGVC